MLGKGVLASFLQPFAVSAVHCYHMNPTATLVLLLPVLPLLWLSGEVLRSMKQFAAGCHDREELMAAAFRGIGGLPRARIARIQKAEEKRVRGCRLFGGCCLQAQHCSC
jgi:hypothetical protein